MHKFNTTRKTLTGRQLQTGLVVAAVVFASACGGSDQRDDTNTTSSNATSGGQGGSAAGAGGNAAGGNAAGGDAAGGNAAGGNAQGGSGEGGDTPPDGSWAHPYLVDAFPYVAQGSTINALSDLADSYFPCGPNTDEGGPEVVYRLNVTAAGWLSARLDDMPGDAFDVDLHLLATDSANACITRHDSWLGAPVTPGDYWLVVDSWVNGAGTALPSDYTLEIAFTEAGNLACLESPVECDGMLPPFVNLSFGEEAGDTGCLPGMARVDDYCIDRYEAVVVTLDVNNNWKPISPYAHPSNSAILMALSVEGAIPQGHISQIQAEDACLTAGKRLCSNPEWLHACQGNNDNTYPYGNTLEPGRCNDDRDCHPVPQYFESAENWIWSELAHPCISQLPEGLAATGSFASCGTAESVFDMMGNLHEWTADPAGTFRGGFYVDTVVNGPGCLYATTAHGTSHHDYSTGFRCCDEATL